MKYVRCCVCCQTFSNLRFRLPQLSGSNRLTGAIPDIFTNFDGLKRLGLGDNLFTGSVPRSIGDLTKLSNLNLCKCR